MKTEEEIRAAQLKAMRPKNALEDLADALQKVCVGSDKDFRRLIVELKKDGLSHQAIAKYLVGEAYDWWVWGN